ncbi:MAG: hypothetical protein O3A87_06010 [Verrucomicrobia bacterium]|nr:hypothetical protein [Verrucomicrobiota bacterium]
MKRLAETARIVFGSGKGLWILLSASLYESVDNSLLLTPSLKKGARRDQKDEKMKQHRILGLR